jgi:hypothetical protein
LLDGQRILNQDDTARFVDRTHTERAIRSGAGQDDRETIAVL